MTLLVADEGSFKTEVTDTLLWRLQAGAMALHLLQAVGSEAVIRQWNVKSRVPLRIAIHPGKFPGQTATSSQLKTIELGEYSVAELVPAFFLLSSFNHAYATLSFDHYKQHVVSAGANPWRWLEYSVSAGLMTWGIGSLAGLNSLGPMLGIVLANVAMQYCGYGVESSVAASLRTGEKPGARPHYDSAWRFEAIGFWAFAAMMVPVLITFYGALDTAEDKVPDFVYSIMVIIAFLYVLFGVVSIMYLRGAESPESPQGIRHVRQSDFGRIEVYYLVLSLVAKTFLAWQWLGGTLREEEQKANRSCCSFKNKPLT